MSAGHKLIPARNKGILARDDLRFQKVEVMPRPNDLRLTGDDLISRRDDLISEEHEVIFSKTEVRFARDKLIPPRNKGILRLHEGKWCGDEEGVQRHGAGGRN